MDNRDDDQTVRICVASRTGFGSVSTPHDVRHLEELKRILEDKGFGTVSLVAMAYFADIEKCRCTKSVAELDQDDFEWLAKQVSYETRRIEG